MSVDRILEQVTQSRGGRYCHVLEVSDKYELESSIEQLCDEWYGTYSKEEMMRFFNTITIYCTNDVNDDEVYDFNIIEFINELSL